MKKLLITGAKGFLGRYVARHFASNGWDVTGVGRGAWESSKAGTWGIARWIESDIIPEELETLPPPEAIVHCAGGASVSVSLADPYKDFQDSVGSTLAVLEYMKEKAPHAKLVFPSSAAVYGNVDAPSLPENTPLKPVSPYGLHKELCERTCSHYSSFNELSISIVRFFSLYGPGLPKQILFDACRKARDGSFAFFGSGKEERDFLHVTDAAKLVHLALGHADPGCPIVNGGSGQGVSVSRLTSLIGRHWQGCPPPTFNGQIREGDPVRLIADVNTASDWGFSPTVDMEYGISEYVDWFRERNS